MVFRPYFVKFCYLFHRLVMFTDAYNRHDHRTKLNRALIWKLIVSQLVEKFMVSVGSLLCSQESSLMHILSQMNPLHVLHLISWRYIKKVIIKNFRCFCLAVFVIPFFQILLSNDKNLCNKAIVNGIRAYKMAEIQQELQEWGTECSLGNGKFNARIYI